MATNECKLREIILNTKKPLILKSFPSNWKCFEGTLDAWCARFDECSTELYVFERMSKKHWNAPQWERHRAKVKLSCLDFLKHWSDAEHCDWYGLNYKRAAEIPRECKEGLDFAYLGFPRSAQDASFWLSSPYANTPCHYDTYGCNIVRQVYGRKSWLLFPPGTPLTRTRIPYEESSVYCSENFYSPRVDDLTDMKRFEKNAYHCILEPGQVLIVPRHWWHYVESIETSLSVNAWIPLECDVEAQVEECIVKFIMERFVACETETMKQFIFNPNQLNQVTDDDELMAILEYLINMRESHSLSKLGEQKYPYHYLDDKILDEMLSGFPNISAVERLQEADFHEILKSNSQRYDSELFDSNITADNNYIKEILINSICCPDVIRVIKENFYQKIERGKSETKFVL